MVQKRKREKMRALPDVVAEALQAIDEAESFTRGMTFEEFILDRRTSRAVERCLQIISEASRHVPKSVQADYPEIPWRKVIDSGNVFRHAYHTVSHRIVWDTVRDDLPILKGALKKIPTDMPTTP